MRDGERALTLIEIMCILGAIVGIALGVIIGHDVFGYYGAYGAVFGAGVGFFAGWMGGFVVALVPFGLGILYERWMKHRRLAPTFGRYWARDRAADWQTVKEQLTAGEPVQGKCVFEPYYGAFFDIGCGFPALLSKSEDDGTTGATLVLRFDDESREITLTRKQRRWLVYEGISVGYLIHDTPALESGEVHWFAVSNRAYSRFREHLQREGTVRCVLTSTDGSASTWIELRGGKQRDRGGYAHLLAS